MKASLLLRPVLWLVAKPSPVSTPLTAPKEKSACPNFASNLSNTGSPSPIGSPLAIHSTTPPEEFNSFFML